ncbi:MAG: flavoprotein, partial [Bacteroidota bacterium]|nr:flavoprotein [Bacteroidota bacterium]
MRLSGKHIVLGVTGSIAAYKAACLLRGLVKEGAEVQVVMTPAAKEFITPVTMSALSGKPVASDFFSANDGTWYSHVDMGQWADLMLIAPATAATFASVAIPEMDRYHYSRKLSAGIVAVGGTLGSLIPPSVTLIVYGMITEQSIGKLFLAAIIPG